jgi:threonyl-tRNA synthetase
MLVVGGKDQAAGTVSVRDRVDGDLGPLPIAEAIEKFRKEVADRTVRQVSRATAGLSTDHVEHAY